MPAPASIVRRARDKARAPVPRAVAPRGLRPSVRRAVAARPAPGALRCRRKFLRLFPHGFRDEDYVALERDYKWAAHRQWNELLGPRPFRALMNRGDWGEVARRAIAIEAKTNLVFSFEKMALRDAVKSRAGARLFAKGLYELLHGAGGPEYRFDRWCEAVARLPHERSRVFTWPVVTVFPFLAQPKIHMFMKPTVMRAAARRYGFDLAYAPRPTWQSYASLLDFAGTVRRDQRDLRPRDMIDIQSFLWIQGSDEYAE
jgi:hypothetical protein